MASQTCRYTRAAVVLSGMMLVLALPYVTAAQTSGSFKVAYYNIKSGRGQVGLTGTLTFANTGNCTDPSMPLNAWGTGLVQQHLVSAVRNDPSIIALGLGEAWACGSPENVRQVLGWRARTSERNGVVMIAKHGFAGPEEWLQLDTSQNINPADTKWVLKQDVCLDAACAQSIPVFVAHWLGTRLNLEEEIPIYDIQAQQTVDFLTRTAGVTPHVLVGDLNVWEGPSNVCAQLPNNSSLRFLRNAGYVDAWPLVHGTAEGFTGMVNRNGCGNPVGYAWKRIDYAWAPAFFQPLSITRFGVVSAGHEAPSDHYGIVAEYPIPAPQGTDSVAPSVRVVSPTGGTFAIGAALSITVEASDDRGVTRVDIVENGTVRHTLSAAPYQVTCTHLTAAAGMHTLAARAYDAAGNHGTSQVVQITVESSTTSGPTGPRAAGPGDIVLHAKDATRTRGNWRLVADAAAAGGARMWNPDAGLAKLNTALSLPDDYFELTFNVQAGVAYRIWMRGRADGNHWTNDSAFFQFSDAVTATGSPIYRIGTTSATWLGVEACSGCPLRNWGWNDNGYGGLGPLVYFATSGQQTVRVQRREDGVAIDQILLSPSQYLTTAPGARVDDATIYVATSTSTPPGPSAAEIVVTANDLKVVSGGWRLLPDASAANGMAFGHPDAGAARINTALAAPVHFVELTFHAEAGRAYRLWLRGRADRDHWANDSVFVQFDESLTPAGQAIARIGTTSSYAVNLEEDAHWGLSGWGWQDNGYGAGVLGPLVSFAATGTQTIRIQTREDGLRIDQVVLSSEKYLTSAPGPLRNDTTILR